MAESNEKPFATVKVPQKILSDMERKRIATVTEWKRADRRNMIKWIILAIVVILLCLWFFTSA